MFWYQFDSKIQWTHDSSGIILKTNHVSNTDLKVYSQILDRGRFQKFKTWNFLHLFISLETHFPKGIEKKSFQGQITAIFPEILMSEN